MMILVNNVAVLLTVEDGTNSLSQNIRSQLADCVMSCRPRRAKAPVSAIFKSSIHWRSHCLEFLWKDRKNQFYSTKACKKGSTIFGRNTLTSPYISFFGLSLLMPSVQDAVSWTQSHCTASWCHLYRMLSAGHSHIVLLPDAICTGCCQLHTVTLYCFLHLFICISEVTVHLYVVWLYGKQMGQGTAERVSLKWIFRKQNGMCNGFIWIRTYIRGGLMCTLLLITEFHKDGKLVTSWKTISFSSKTAIWDKLVNV